MLWIIPIVILIIIVAGIKIIPQSRAKVVERLGSYYTTLQKTMQILLPMVALY